MALSDEDREEVYSIVNEALDLLEVKERERTAKRIADKIALGLEYDSAREQVRKKANGRQPGVG